MTSNTNSLNKSENIDCKGCKKTFKKTSISIHINHYKNKTCKNFYTESELAELERDAKSRQELAIKSWRKTNSAKVSNYSHDWYDKLAIMITEGSCTKGIKK